ncbi:MAG TPA: hypothetical protein VMZ29_16940 [Candidatus Bathyarchaeia archaeon]|nr:hypothetical protein [Candidatus Bathyarchaeia archaeon]
MVQNSFLSILEKIKFIEEKEPLLGKLMLPEFDSFRIISKEAQDCLYILEEINNITRDLKLSVEDIKPVILNLKSFQSKLNNYLPHMSSSNEVYNLLIKLYRNSQELLAKSQYISDAEFGGIMSDYSDAISVRNFSFSRFFYLNETSFHELLISIYNVIFMFEKNGISPLRSHDPFKPLINDIIDFVKLFLYISKNFVPYQMYAQPPSAFESIAKIGEKIAAHLNLIRVSKALINLYGLITEALDGLEKLALKYQSKPKKKFNIDALFFVKDGIEELNELLQKTSKYID